MNSLEKISEMGQKWVKMRFLPEMVIFSRKLLFLVENYY